MLAYLLSKPDGWEVRIGDLERMSPAGRDKTRRIVRELRDAGYLHRTRENDDNGTFQWSTTVYETPELNPHFTTIDGFPVDGSPVDGKPVDGKPVDIVSTERESTECNAKQRENPFFSAFSASLGTPAGGNGSDHPPADKPPEKTDCEKKRKPRKKKQWEATADEMAEWFTELTQLSPPENSFGGYVKLWRKPLRRMVDLYDGDTERAKQAIRDVVDDFWNRDKPLTIHSPNSVLKTVESNAARERREDAVPMTVTEYGGVW